jgi:CRISPR-associated protein Csx17
VVGRLPELPVRVHWSPTTANGRAFEIRNDSLFLGPDQVCSGLDLEKDCVALVLRRVLMARSPRVDAGYPAGRLPLRAPASCCASLADIMLFLDDATRDAQISGLARAFMAIDWQRWHRHGRAAAGSASRIDPDYAIIRLAHAPDGVWREGEGLPIALEPETIRRLVTGDLAGAAAVAVRRLRVSGLRPVVQVLIGDPQRARRIAAALAFPITALDLARCADRVCKPFEAAEASDSTAHPTEAR